jgi:hypothetical protein
MGLTVNFHSQILSSQFHHYLRAVPLPYELETSTEVEAVLAQIDPLEIAASAKSPQICVEADELKFI